MAIIEAGGQTYRVLEPEAEVLLRLRALLAGFEPEDGESPRRLEEFSLAGGTTSTSGSLLVTAQGGVIAVVPDGGSRRAMGFGGQG